MLSIQFAGEQAKEQLKSLWLRSFSDLPQAVDFFLQTWLTPDSCVAMMQEDRVVSALYLLPAEIQNGRNRWKGHYLYGASTLPEYRGQGLMKRLLDFAGTVAAKTRGDFFSVLLPADGPLYEFYRSCGYREAFYTRMVPVERAELTALAEGGQRLLPSAPAFAPYRHRETIIGAIPGSVQWGERYVEYAFRLNRLYGGASVNSCHGYALLRGEGEVCEVLEWMPCGDGLSLLRDLLQASPAGLFRFRLPVNSTFFLEKGAIIPFGMIKPLSNAPKIEGIGPFPPYLGLTLD